jgi:hypothetical protein
VGSCGGKSSLRYSKYVKETTDSYCINTYRIMNIIVFHFTTPYVIDLILYR